MNVQIFNTREQLARGFCDFLVHDTRNILQHSKQYSLALSGGSTPINVFRMLAEEYRTRIPWDCIHFYWGDERCVPPDHPESNYGSARVILFDQLHISDDHIHRIKGEAEPEAEAAHYGSLLTQMLPAGNHFPVFDLVMLGMGDDGHTASIFPDRPDLLTSNYNCAVALHPDTGQKRITITGGVILEARAIVILVSGTSKREMLESILQEKEFALRFPAAILGRSPSARWFCDRDASPGKQYA